MCCSQTGSQTTKDPKDYCHLLCGKKKANGAFVLFCEFVCFPFRLVFFTTHEVIWFLSLLIFFRNQEMKGCLKFSRVYQRQVMELLMDLF